MYLFIFSIFYYKLTIKLFDGVVNEMHVHGVNYSLVILWSASLLQSARHQVDDIILNFYLDSLFFFFMIDRKGTIESLRSGVK